MNCLTFCVCFWAAFVDSDNDEDEATHPAVDQDVSDNLDARSDLSADPSDGIRYMFYLIYLSKLMYFLVIFYIARIRDEDEGYERDLWMKTKRNTKIDEPLRADR
jgi:hypothetical protein